MHEVEHRVDALDRRPDQVGLLDVEQRGVHVAGPREGVDVALLADRRHDVVPLGEQRRDQPGADVAGRAGHEYAHEGSASWVGTRGWDRRPRAGSPTVPGRRRPPGRLTATAGLVRRTGCRTPPGRSAPHAEQDPAQQHRDDEQADADDRGLRGPLRRRRRAPRRRTTGSRAARRLAKPFSTSSAATSPTTMSAISSRVSESGTASAWHEERAVVGAEAHQPVADGGPAGEHRPAPGHRRRGALDGDGLPDVGAAEVVHEDAGADVGQLRGRRGQQVAGDELEPEREARGARAPARRRPGGPSPPRCPRRRPRGRGRRSRRPTATRGAGRRRPAGRGRPRPGPARRAAARRRRRPRRPATPAGSR